MIKLSKRLNKIVSYVDENSKIADVGTDHGFVPNFLVEEKNMQKVIATDISLQSLEKSIEFSKLRGNFEFIEHRVGNGLKAIEPNEVDTVIIAGMGGYLIVDLLKESMDLVKNLKKLILQPMQNQEYLREYLYENGYEILDESIVYEENKYFELIVARYNGDIIHSDEIYYKVPKSAYNRKDRECIGFLEYKINYNNYILRQMVNNKDNSKVKDRVNAILDENEKYKELLCNIQSENL